MLIDFKLATKPLLSIKARVFEALGQFEQAVALRQTQINKGNRNLVFYHAQVQYYLRQGDKDQAHEVDCTG